MPMPGLQTQCTNKCRRLLEQPPEVRWASQPGKLELGLMTGGFAVASVRCVSRGVPVESLLWIPRSRRLQSPSKCFLLPIHLHRRNNPHPSPQQAALRAELVRRVEACSAAAPEHSTKAGVFPAPFADPSGGPPECSGVADTTRTRALTPAFPAEGLTLLPCSILWEQAPRLHANERPLGAEREASASGCEFLGKTTLSEYLHTCDSRHSSQPSCHRLPHSTTNPEG
mmetsp:Transcript_62695/g.149641  ORF Transcript_62695/g.149641 Transcript_62695/m.149641 type:complete len:227 (+) Transcript_62695:1182-1862(+)